MRKTTTISIDSDILRLAKREIPNISLFIEDCFKTYLGINDEINNIASIQKELDTMKDCQLKIHLLSKLQDSEGKLKDFDGAKVNETWREVWRHYRNTETIVQDKDLLTQILGMEYEDLKELLDYLLTYVPKSEYSNCEDFSIAKKWWNNDDL